MHECMHKMMIIVELRKNHEHTSFSGSVALAFSKQARA